MLFPNAIWARSRRCGCLVTWFCYQLIAKPGNKTAAPPWLDPYKLSYVCLHKVFLWLDIHGKQNAYYCQAVNATSHYNDVIMGAIASQITSLKIVYSTVYSCADQRKHQSSASLAFVRGIRRRPVNSPHKWPVTRKMFPFDDVIMRYWVVYSSVLFHSQFCIILFYYFFPQGCNSIRIITTSVLKYVHRTYPIQ